MVKSSVRPVPEFIDPVFAKTSSKRLFSMTENERFGLVFTKTWSINSGTGGGKLLRPPAHPLLVSSTLKLFVKKDAM
jgi:hypothetical protein